MAGNKKAKNDENINFDALLQAIKACLLNNTFVRTAARSFNVPRSTLTRHVEKVKKMYPDISNVSDNDLMDLLKFNRMHLPSNMVS